ncbi:MAG TPA: NAD(P)/FAD-dependent oxidoreductase [Ferruginibacter sp.]|jgi:monoamine oxidase|nr:NAD(P)/FAD-dependent oxidoreductase [Ferruginibacter sp.]
MKEKVIVIGAGAAGLMAAKELAKKGIDVIILEANERIGGRINTILDPAFDLPIESGAEFIHGNLPLTIQLLKTAKINFHPIGDERAFVKNGEWNSSADPIPHWDTLIKKMKDVTTDITIADFLERYFAEEKCESLRSNIRRYAEGFDLADIHTASTIALRNEWMQEEHEQYRINGGYDMLIQYLAQQCKKRGALIYTSCAATKIEWQRDTVKVFTKDGRSFESNKVIITVPVSILQKNNDDQNAIRFEPAIDEQKSAAGKIGYGSVIKIFLQFDHPFWEEKSKDLAFIISDQMVPTWWTQTPDKSATLIGWLGGPSAKALMKADEKIIIKLSLESLAVIFSIEFDTLQSYLKMYKISDWSQDPFSLGAYSFATTQTSEARKLLKRPVQQTLFFAGEGLYEGDYPGTVEAALITGRDVARSITRVK